MGEPTYIPSYTVADYEQWEGEWELWNGVPVAMTPPAGLDHQRLGRKLLLMIQRQLDEQGCRCEVLYESGWKISEATVLVPDLMVVCEPADGDYVLETPGWVIELLSPSTASRDRLEKRRMYAAAGLGYYLIADPRDPTRGGKQGPRFEALKLVDGEYESLATDAPGTFDLHAGCAVTLDPAAIF